MVAERMDETGETGVELPVLLGPEDDPFHEEPSPSRAKRVRGGRRG